MKKRFIIIFILISVVGYSQVGINTTNPQGRFHVDGGTDNAAVGAPTATQQKNDFIVTASGNVGIGKSDPQKKLDIDADGASLRIANLAQSSNQNDFFLTLNPVNGDVTATSYTYTASITLDAQAKGTISIPTDINIPSGFLVVKSDNSCGTGMIANFIYSTNSAFGYSSGIAGDKVSTSTIAPIPGSSTGAGNAVWSIKFPQTLDCDTGNSTQFNFTITRPTNSSFSIVNDGNVTRTYVLTIFRL
ncbi:hypothetical protein [Chryseobacterium sp.]|uniref:hypothetical protein n=1 Tax=Chryseobacterium sp. TaxID=1871047 RepID=UPI002897FEE2|nr:hypothetical protein [Chryseobacterium sp.]